MLLSVVCLYVHAGPTVRRLGPQDRCVRYSQSGQDSKMAGVGLSCEDRSGISPVTCTARGASLVFDDQAAAAAFNMGFFGH